MRKIYIKQHLLVCAFLMLSCIAFAQSATISGKIVDETNQSLPGATVTIKGTQTSTGTDVNGTYRLSGLSAGAYVLRVSFTGYDVIEKPVTLSSSMVINFNLVPASKSLNEVVVIGYGSQKKRDLTGAITVVSAKDFNTGVNTTPEQLIQGKVAGVSIISNSGAPGAGSQIRIRGLSTINGGAAPLIVVDGIPLSPATIAGVANPLDLINPNDIASFSILKDASATAIYGNRASNGVILVTTKKGQSGKPVINFTTQLSASKLPKTTPVLSADQFRKFIMANDTVAPGTYSKFLGSANTNWQKEIYQTAITTDNNLSISGTKGKLPYRVSVGYINQDGILKTSNLQRYTGNINLSPSLFTDHLKINFNAIGSRVDQRFAKEDAIGNAIAFNPTLPVYSGNSSYGGYTEYVNADGSYKANTPVNPLAQLNQQQDRSHVYRLIANLGLDYKFHFLPDLHANVNLSYDGTNGHGTKVVSDSSKTTFPRFIDSTGNAHSGSRTKYKSVYDNKLLEAFLSYNKDIKAINSRIEAVAGYAYQDFKTTDYNYASYYGDNYQVPESTPDYLSNINQYRLLSYYGRVNFTYADKYILTGTIRDDYSSKFAPGLRSGVFPSGAFAWRIKQEDFLKDSQTISDLKLRLGYGQTGDQDGIGDYDYLADFSLSTPTAQYRIGDNYYQAYRPNAYYFNRTWERTAQSNIGLDYGFLDNRINGSIDYYYKKTSKLLATIAQPALANFSNQIVGNVGTMENSGVEFTINADVIKSKDLNWSVGFNASYYKNKILSLPGALEIRTGSIAGGTGSNIQADFVGSPINSFYVLQQVYGANGKPVENLFVDRNGDGTITEKDQYLYKSPDPTVVLGLNSNVNYKRWSGGFVARANIGNYAYYNVGSNRGVVSSFIQSLSGGIISNGSASVLQSGLIGTTSNDRISDYYVQNASFIRMDNVHVGYNFGSVFGNSATLSVSANVQNVFIITNYKGIDPELVNGIDNQLYPRPRTFVLGLNLNIK